MNKTKKNIEKIEKSIESEKKANELLHQLCRKYGLEQRQGTAGVNLEGAHLYRINQYEEAMPLLYERGFSFIGEGYKVGHSHGKKFRYGPDSFLVVTTPQPVECEAAVFEEGPLVGLYLDLNLKRLHRIASQMSDHLPHIATSKIPPSLVAVPRTPVIQQVFLRLLHILLDPLEIEVLGEAILDELYFRLLQDKKAGPVLQNLCQQGGSFARIARVVDYLHSALEEKITIDKMASMAGMSSNNFHRLFKEAMNDTPVQYIKKVRLSKARQLLSYQNYKVVDAAFKVGYECPYQFSREFKRYFGVPPSQAGELGFKNF